ncbi:MAG: DUF134 domain-containing protein [Dehalococcoidales bacterium]|nr:DUF134 domain-containing protein [Dehalococcoidales bacterium]
MGRQPRWRRVGSLPQVTYFKPAGVPLANIQEVRLSIEEAEAIRLKDVEGLEQDACAQKMSVSRSTFARILLAARQKMADAILNGKAIRIEGGNYEMAIRHFRCGNGHEWEVPFEVMTKQPPEICPTCNTSDIMSLWPWSPGLNMAGQSRQFRGGRNHGRGGD